MNKQREFKHPVVLVAGAGMAGIAAAVASARAGHETLLVERHRLPGGMASNALVHTICGLYRLRNNDSEPLVYANEGLPREFAELLLAAGAAMSPVRMGRLDVLPHDPSGLASVAKTWVLKSPNLAFMPQTILKAVHKSNGKIIAARLETQGRTIEVALHALVDATGDAEAVALAGADFECALPDRLQRPAYIFEVGGVLENILEGDARLHLAGLISHAVMQGSLPEEALGIAFRHGVSRREIWATLDLQADPYDPCSPECLERVEECGRHVSDQILRHLRSHAKGFENAHISRTPLQLGIRESRRLVGREQLTAEDILHGCRAVESLPLAAWPLELRENARGPRFHFPEGNRPAGIPPGCLRSRTVDNLFAAGRCISCTHEAQASIRVTGTCLATGEAAGTLAAWI